MFGIFRLKNRDARWREKRRAQRMPVRAPAEIVVSARNKLRCMTVNVSDGGAKLELPRDRMLPSEFEVVIPAREIRRRARVVWRSSDELGVQFV